MVVPGVHDGPAGVVGLAARALGLSRGGARARGSAETGIMAVTLRCWPGRWVLAADGEAAG